MKGVRILATSKVEQVEQVKIGFRKPHQKTLKVETPTGNGMMGIYEYQTKANGKKRLVKTGEKNIYNEIQAQLENTKIENVLKRVACGDMSDFRPTGIYQDISAVPKNFIEAQHEIDKVRKLWEQQPNEIKAKYDFDLNTFMAHAGEKAWGIDVGLINVQADERAAELESMEQAALKKAGEMADARTDTSSE